MNDQNTERKHGIVFGFARFNENMIISMKNDVGLGISLESFKAIQEHYKSINRDPSLDEFYLIERIIESKGSAAYPVGVLMTDFDVIAETYADMMSKYRSLGKLSSMPHLRPLSSVAHDYLTRSGKKLCIPKEFAVSYGEGAELELILNGFVPCESDYDSALSTCRKRNSTPMIGDMLVIVSKWGMMNSDSFESLATDLLGTPEGQMLHGGRIVRESGIVGAICEMCSGAFVDLTVLPDIEHPCDLTALCDASHGAMIVAIPTENVNQFMRAAYEQGLFSAVIGNIASDGCLTVRTDKMVPVSIKTSFLSSLGRTETSEYCINGLEYFNMALRATLDAIAKKVAEGVRYTDIALSFHYTLPGNAAESVTRGNALALILGAYRAQIEFNIPDVQSRISIGDKPDISVAAISKKHPTNSDSVSTNASFVYLLEPLTVGSSLPDFEDLRRMWDYVCFLRQKGVIASSVDVDNLVNDAVDAIVPEDYVFSPGADCKTTAAPGAIVAMATNNIQGSMIGSIRKKSPLSGETDTSNIE